MYRNSSSGSGSGEEKLSAGADVGIALAVLVAFAVAIYLAMTFGRRVERESQKQIEGHELLLVEAGQTEANLREELKRRMRVQGLRHHFGPSLRDRATPLHPRPARMVSVVRGLTGLLKTPAAAVPVLAILGLLLLVPAAMGQSISLSPTAATADLCPHTPFTVLYLAVTLIACGLGLAIRCHDRFMSSGVADPGEPRQVRDHAGTTTSTSFLDHFDIILDHL